MNRLIYKHANKYSMVEGDKVGQYRVYMDISEINPKGHYAGKVNTILDGVKIIKTIRDIEQVIAVNVQGNEITFKDIENTIAGKNF